MNIAQIMISCYSGFGAHMYYSTSKIKKKNQIKSINFDTVDVFNSRVLISWIIIFGYKFYVWFT